ncbi:MAG: ribonuclease HII [Candidatus Berkelbacteria bacterium]|nr:MAG: ribonuclease HII [Candidatus Berkelbacteria bacterium]QQG51996.1 MAG: ribonuclease HII [Candidatus Berkelbacteria bacterium]
MLPKKLRPRPLSPSTPDFHLLKQLQDLGYQEIVGVDEVGRGALAGPVIVAAVEIATEIPGVNDSKLLERRFRAEVAQIIHRSVVRIRFGYASHLEIDSLGLSQALRLAYQRALSEFEADLVLTDHYDPPTKCRYIRATHGDSLFYPVAAASIVAKVYRDQLMKVYDRFFPEYVWHQNAGYGTAFHRQKISEIGPCTLHRQSFL